MSNVRNRAALKVSLAAGAIILFLFCSCGEVNSIFPGSPYEVSADIGMDSLDGSALVREGDKIRPYFLHSVRNDTDIRGLRVVVETPSGRQVGEAVLYQTGAAEEADLAVNDSPKDRIIRVARMDEAFSSFTLSESLEAGAYVMAFQVLGDGHRLISKTEKPFYYLAGMDYTVVEIKASLPGFSSTPYLIHPGTPVLLEAQVEADQGLDPYIVWYNGKTRIKAGNLGAGADSFLWTIPNSLSFLHLRAEVTPFPPPDSRGSSDGAHQGKTKELSLPVSTKGRIEGTLDPLVTAHKAEDPGRKLRYYRFAGDLLNSLDPVQEQALLPRETRGSPLWISSGYIYGLAVGPQDRYRIPVFPLSATEETPGSISETNRYRIILNLKPLTPGVIAAVFFGETRLELSWEDEAVNLDIISGGLPDRRRLIDSPLAETDEFITLPLDFLIRGKEISVILGDEYRMLGHILEAEGYIQLGGEAFSDSVLPVMILDELVLINYPDVSVVAYSESGRNTRILTAL